MSVFDDLNRAKTRRAWQIVVDAGVDPEKMSTPVVLSLCLFWIRTQIRTDQLQDTVADLLDACPDLRRPAMTPAQAGMAIEVLHAPA